MPAQIIQMMVCTQIMTIWTPATTLQDHLKCSSTCSKYVLSKHQSELDCKMCMNVKIKIALFRDKVRILIKIPVGDHWAFIFIGGKN